MASRLPLSHIVVLASLTTTSPALAQATTNVVTGAEDAFGAAAGNESVGIYTLSSVRGFDLEAAGNYRVNGRYFVKSSGVSDFFIAHSDVRIGYNALNLTFPGPSGAVDYTLRDPRRGEANIFTLGLDVYHQPYAELLLQHRNAANTFSSAIGLNLNFDSGDEQGGRGQGQLLAGVARFSPSEHARIQAFAGEYHYVRDGRFAVVLPALVQSMPAAIERARYLGQDWAEERGQRRIAGVLTDVLLDDGWRWSTAAVFSQDVPERGFTHFFAPMADASAANGRVVALPEQTLTAYSSESSFGWRGQLGSAQHDIALYGRFRATRNHFGGAVLFDLGEGVLGEPFAQAPAPDLGNHPPLQYNSVDQVGLGLSWRMHSEHFRLNAGMLHTDYHKSLVDGQGSETESTARPWLYNFGAAVTLRPGLEIYGSYSRGIEEAGVAPATAANRNAILPAGISTQSELGLRLALTPALNFIIAGFDTRKPLPGMIAASNVYDIVADVRHRGIETSLTGALTPNLTIVLGGVYTDASASGANVSDGTIGPRPVAVPAWRLVGSVSYEPDWARGLSLDAALQAVGEQSARAAPLVDGSQLAIPSSTVLDVGLRYTFNPDGNGWTLRAQLKNVTDTYSWRVNRAETLDYIPARSIRVLFTRTF